MRELEEKRINKEMAHIRQKFKGTLYTVREEGEGLLTDAPPLHPELFVRIDGNLDGRQKKK